MTNAPGTTSTTRPRRGGADHPGPPLTALIAASVLTLLIGILIGPVSGAGATPSPFSSTQIVSSYFADHQTVVATSAWLLLLSSVTLVLFSAIVHSRLSFLAPNAPGPVIAGFGGVAAAILLAVSAVGQWALSNPAVSAQPELVHALHFIDFAAGGPAHVAALAVLTLGVSVTTVFVNRTPRWMSYLGIGLGVIDILSTLSLLTESVTPLVPIGRFASLAWLIGMSVLIPRDRGARRPATV